MTTHPWRHARFVWAQRGAAGNLGFASRHASSFTGPPTLGRFKQTPVGRRVIRSVNPSITDRTADTRVWAARSAWST